LYSGINRLEQAFVSIFAVCGKKSVQDSRLLAVSGEHGLLHSFLSECKIWTSDICTCPLSMISIQEDLSEFDVAFGLHGRAKVERSLLSNALQDRDK
jgi:hypothetical protein